MSAKIADDLQGRLMRVETRLAMIAQSLNAFATAYSDLGPPSRDTVWGFADIAEELAEEVRDVYERYVDESNADFFKIRALEASPRRSTAGGAR